MKKNTKLIFALILLGALILLATGAWFILAPPTQKFDGERALQDASYQVSLGPRIPGSPSQDTVREWVKTELSRAGWEVSEQKTVRMGHAVINITGKKGKGTPWIILGAHYDCRMTADQEKNASLSSLPVPGANDGASGVAVLLGLARSLPANLDKEVWLVFFDAEDQGGFPGWDWILGSRAYADQLTRQPQAVVIVDMIGDRDLNIYYEKNSNAAIMQEIWSEAGQAGFSRNFISTYRFSMEDDHTPFIEKGIPAVDIIDFNYPYWHTTQDTTDKISAESLNAVGTTLKNWILKTKGIWQN